MINLKEDGKVTLNTKEIIKENKEEINEKKIPLDLNFSYDDIKGIKIETIEEFEKIKLEILKCFYVYLFKKNEEINIITDNNRFFIINTDNIPIDIISDVLVFRKPKKIIVDIKEFSDLVKENSSSFWDLKFLIKLLWGLEVEDARDISRYINMPSRSKKNAYQFSSNLIRLAKEINIYIEKNKLNKYVLLENEILIQSIVLEKKGVPISITKYNNFKKKLIDRYNEIMNNKNSVYGENFDFSKEETIKYLSKNNKILSLEQSILKNEQSKLAEEIRIYKNFENMKKHKINNDRFIVCYDIYRNHQIYTEPLPNTYYYSDKNIYLVEGSFNNLYLRILAELTRDKELIEAASNSQFIEHLNTKVLENKKLDIFSEMFIKAYAKQVFEPIKIQEFIYSEFDTLLNEKDISRINKMFEEKASNLFNFFKYFEGNAPEYDRYNTKIFFPNTNLDEFVKQIKNLIMKTAISYINSTIYEYQSKYRNNEDSYISVSAFTKDKIILESSEKSLPVATDILNRYMAISYKKYIKNTKYHNLTNVVNYSEEKSN